MKLTKEQKNDSKKLTIRANRILSSKRKSTDPDILKQYNDILTKEGYPISIEMERGFIESVVRRGKLSKKNHRSLRKRINPKKKLRNRSNPSLYKTYIESELWEQRKNQYYQSHSKECARCGSYSFIALHHMYYDNANYGHESDDHLIPLCRSCHMQFHNEFKTKKNMIKETLWFINRFKDPSVPDLPIKARKVKIKTKEKILVAFNL